MKIISRGSLGLLAGALVLASVACNKKDNAATDTAMAATPAAPAPLHVTDVSTGKGLGADKTLATPTTDFRVTDTIYVVVTTDGASAGAKLDAKWTYQGKQTVNESSEIIAPAGGTNRTEFHIQKATAWPKGNYKVEIMLDGTSTGSKDFTVK